MSLKYVILKIHTRNRIFNSFDSLSQLLGADRYHKIIVPEEEIMNILDNFCLLISPCCFISLRFLEMAILILFFLQACRMGSNICSNYVTVVYRTQ